MKKNNFLTLKYVLMTFFVIFTLLPFVWIFYSSFRSGGDLFSGKFLINENGLSFKNYIRVFTTTQVPFYRYIINSVVVAVVTTLLALIVSSLGAFALSRYDMKLRNIFILVLLSSNMFPRVLLLIPFFNMLLTANLVDTYLGLISSHLIIGLPFNIWLLKGYFDTVPIELDQAAMIDGLEGIGILWKIILPLAAPGLVVAAFFSFMVSWGDYLFASIISQSLNTQTLPIGLSQFFSSTQVQWGAINAATIITIIPTVIIFSILQKWIVEGLTSGSVKG